MDKLLSEAIRHRIDRSGCTGRKDHLTRGGCTDQSPHLFTRHLIRRGTLLTHVVESPVNICIEMTMQVIDLLNHRQGLLSGRPAVQIDQLLPVNLTVQQRKVGPYFSNIVCHLYLLYHASILAPISRSKSSFICGTPLSPKTSNTKPYICNRRASSRSIPRWRI